jgi:hypothetical protein
MASNEPSWKVRVAVEGVIAGLVAPIAVGILLLFLGTQAGEWFDSPTCEDPENLRLVDATGATASSVHEDTELEGGRKHPASHAHDGDLGTGWVENAPDFGTGEWIEFELPAGTNLRMVCVVNGYAKSAELYQVNGRARQITTQTDRGTTTASLPDKPTEAFAEFQQVTIASGSTDSVRLTIRSVRASAGSSGTKDTAISEVEFWGE